jgi:hypothetical protein
VPPPEVDRLTSTQPLLRVYGVVSPTSDTTEEWIEIYDTPRPKNDQYRKGIGFADAYIKYKEWELSRKIDHQYDRKSRNAFFNEITTLASIHSWITVKVAHHKKHLVVARKPADVVVLYPQDEEEDEDKMAEVAL